MITHRHTEKKKKESDMIYLDAKNFYGHSLMQLLPTSGLWVHPKIASNQKRILLNYFNHEAYKAYYKSEPYNPQSFTHNLHKLRIIETKIKDETVESFLLTRTIKNYLANSNDKKGGETLYDIYMDRISSKNDKAEICCKNHLDK